MRLVVLKTSFDHIIVVFVKTVTYLLRDIDLRELVVIAGQALVLVLQFVEKVIVDHRLLRQTEVACSLEAMQLVAVYQVLVLGLFTCLIEKLLAFAIIAFASIKVCVYLIQELLVIDLACDARVANSQDITL